MITAVVSKVHTDLTMNNPHLSGRIWTIQPARSLDATGFFQDT